MTGGQPRINDNSNGGGTPDVLITNYSMLEYMLKRPLEHIMFKETRDWLEKEDNKLVLVLDEAHLYQGALGTEIGMLLRRLRMALGIAGKEEKIQFILTSASLGKRRSRKGGVCPRAHLADRNRGLTITKRHSLTGRNGKSQNPWLTFRNFDAEEAWISALKQQTSMPLTRTYEKRSLPCPTHLPTRRMKRPGSIFEKHQLYARMYDLLSQKAQSMSELAESLLGSKETRSIHAMELILNFVAALKGELNIPNRKDLSLAFVRTFCTEGLRSCIGTSPRTEYRPQKHPTSVPTNPLQFTPCILVAAVVEPMRRFSSATKATTQKVNQLLNNSSEIDQRQTVPLALRSNKPFNSRSMLRITTIQIRKKPRNISKREISCLVGRQICSFIKIKCAFGRLNTSILPKRVNKPIF